MAGLFKVKALYEFEAKEEDDLAFPGGQIIDVTEEVDDNWLEGKYTDAAGVSHAGIFPREFVEKYEPERPARPSGRPAKKQEAAPAPIAAPVPAAIPSVKPEAEEREDDDGDDDDTPPIPASSKPPSLPTAPREDLPAQAKVAPSQKPPTTNAPPPAPRPTPAEPATSASSSKKPPPVAAKSNAFKDRIAAFNQGGNAAPIAPIQPGKTRASDFIKKPFVAPPPSANSYVPPPRVEPIHKPYMREEDPEIKQRQEEDQALAESAGLTSEAQPEEGEDAPKAVSLKERIALLQKQQMEQAQRRAEPAARKERKAPIRKPSEPSEQGTVAEADDEDLGQGRSRDPTERRSMDTSRAPRVPSVQRRPTESMSPPPVPEHDIVSDGNEADQSAAGETTEDDAGTIGPDDSDDHSALPVRAAVASKREPDVGDEEDTTETGEDIEEDEEDDMDEETRRKLELRERMAKMSGGMGMPGMFGAMPLPGSAPRRPTKKLSEDSAATSPTMPQQRIPMVPVPGLSKPQEPQSSRVEESEDDDEQEDLPTPAPPRRSMTEERGAPPPVPTGSRPPPLPPQDKSAPPRRSMTGEDRAVPPVPNAQATSRPVESRPVPPPPQGMLSPGPGSESDDEASVHANSGIDTPGPLPVRTQTGGMAPPIPSREVPPRTPLPPDATKRASYISGPSEPATSTAEKRAIRLPPPLPTSPQAAASRPPPPPPPGNVVPAGLQATGLSTTDEDDDRGESEYEGDYDTDIAPSAKHKDALRSHARDESLDDGSITTDDPMSSPPLPPQTAAPRAVPPPPPSSHVPPSRPDRAPGAPPPVPSRDEEYDPYRSSILGGVPVAAPPMPPSKEADQSSADDSYPPPRSVENRPPPPPPQAPAFEAALPSRARQSMDARDQLSVSQGPAGRQSLEMRDARRSTDAPRPSGDHSQIAADLPLNQETPWWTVSNPLPPVLQPRRGIDILSEYEESTSTKRGGQSVVTKNIYILFADYSETSISAKYDAREPMDCEIEQSHKAPPGKLRQDQLEGYWHKFGRSIAEKTSSLAHGSGKKDSSGVGDGSPASLVSELVKEHTAALQPIGTKSYGALVYANLGNASTLQFDEIRPGDIVTLRGARFEGHHGAMKTKYRSEFGASGVGHVAVVEEWDGTKRAIRVWEQGREAIEGKREKKSSGGVKSEKLRLGDLRSGEVRVWRVVGRDWVGW